MKNPQALETCLHAFGIMAVVSVLILFFPDFTVSDASEAPLSSAPAQPAGQAIPLLHEDGGQNVQATHTGQPV